MERNETLMEFIDNVQRNELDDIFNAILAVMYHDDVKKNEKQIKEIIKELYIADYEITISALNETYFNISKTDKLKEFFSNNKIPEKEHKNYDIELISINSLSNKYDVYFKKNKETLKIGEVNFDEIDSTKKIVSLLDEKIWNRKMKKEKER